MAPRTSERRLSRDMLKLADLFAGKVDPALRDFVAHHGLAFLEQVGSDDQPHSRLSDGRTAERWQDDIILSLVPEGASVLDLGCGGGDLLARLARDKGVRPQGIEMDPDEVLRCIERGVPVFQCDMQSGLAGFPDHSFDYVILEETLQTLLHPGKVLEEMRRVGRRGIVSFPNFGYWRVRLDLAVTGRMPITEWLPHRWHDTPNIHLFSIRDFQFYARENQLNVVETHVLVDGEIRLFRTGDNLHAEEALCLFESGDPDLPLAGD